MDRPDESKYAKKQRRKKEEALVVAPERRSSVVTTVVPTRNIVLEPREAVWTHFCAGAMFEKGHDGLWYVAGVTDERFPNEVKLSGGTNIDWPSENKYQTLCRELREELLVQVDPHNCGQLVHRVINEARSHTQYFFFVRDWWGRWREGSFQDSDGHFLIAKRLTLAGFWNQCFAGHRQGFREAVHWVSRSKLHTERDFMEKAVAARIISPLT